MKAWLLAVAGATCLFLVGCRTDPAITMLEQDNFRKEREIERLHNRLEDVQGELQALRCKPTSATRAPREMAEGPLFGLPGNASSTESATNEPSSEKPAATTPHRAVPGTAPTSPRGPSSESPPASVEPPNVEIPSEATPKGQIPPILKVPDGAGGSASARDGADATHPDSTRDRWRQVQARSVGMTRSLAEVRRTANVRHGASHLESRAHRRVRGRQQAWRPRLVGPRRVARRGRTDVGRPRALSVVLLDSALTGEAARVARWNFTASDAAHLMRFNGNEVGIPLDLHWPGDPPAHAQLDLFVRYTTRDGRKLEVHQPVEVAMHGIRSTRSVPEPVDGPELDAALPESWHPSSESEVPTPPAPAVLMATRPADDTPQRPVWSPERR